MFWDLNKTGVLIQKKEVTIAFLKGAGDAMIDLTEGMENLDQKMKNHTGLIYGWI